MRPPRKAARGLLKVKRACAKGDQSSQFFRKKASLPRCPMTRKIKMLRVPPRGSLGKQQQQKSYEWIKRNNKKNVKKLQTDKIKVVSSVMVTKQNGWPDRQALQWPLLNHVLSLKILLFGLNFRNEAIFLYTLFQLTRVQHNFVKSIGAVHPFTSYFRFQE